MLTVSGVMLVLVRGYHLAEAPWLIQGIGALGVATVIWLGALLPDQWRMERLGPDEGSRLRRLFVRWTVLGWVANGALLYGLWAMVTKQ
jgi:uncharacterized membrane protein